MRKSLWLYALPALIGLAVCGVGAHSAPKGAAPPAVGEKSGPPDFREMAKEGIARALPMVQTSAETFSKREGCVSCHHQTLSMVAVHYVRGAGLPFDAAHGQAEAEKVHGFLGAFEKPLQAALTDPKAMETVDHNLVDPSITAASLLYAMGCSNHAPDNVTSATAAYLARKQQADGRWPVIVARPPLEGSEFTATALAVYSLKRYAPASNAADTRRRIASARNWLLATKPKTTEDKTFRLWGLRWAGASEPEIARAVETLASEQRDDGGWAQLPTLNMATDAYATGQVLVALHEAGSVPVENTIYQRGFAYLLLNQKSDGSWFVAKRTAPGQPFVDVDFPHGESQFISFSGTCWAIAALSLGIGEPATIPPAPTQTAEATRSPPPPFVTKQRRGAQAKRSPSALRHILWMDLFLNSVVFRRFDRRRG